MTNLFELHPEGSAYRYIWNVLMQDHIQASIDEDWRGPEGYHRLCTLLDEGHPFAVPVIGGESAGLVWGEAIGSRSLEGHLAFDRGISPSLLSEAMDAICEYCSKKFDTFEVNKKNLPRAARMFVRRCGFEERGDKFIKDLV